jgi:hypothetical protein
MRQSLFFLAPLVGLLVTTSGCTREGFGPEPIGASSHHADVGRHSGARAVGGLLDALALGYEIAEAARNSDAEGATVSPDDGYPPDDGSPPEDPGYAATFHTVPPAADPAHEARAFDLGSAYGEIARVDVGTCKADGLATGYGRVILGFDDSGAPTSVGVEIPAGSTPAARSCLENAFRKVHVAPFDGAAVNVRRAFYVKA